MAESQILVIRLLMSSNYGRALSIVNGAASQLTRKVRDRDDAFADTREDCAPQTARVAAANVDENEIR